jgi:hypothetical protein
MPEQADNSDPLAAASDPAARVFLKTFFVSIP